MGKLRRSAHSRQTPGALPAPPGKREGLSRSPETVLERQGLGSFLELSRLGEGAEGLSTGTLGSRLLEVKVPLRRLPVGVKRPKKAHLFPTLKNLVPMATESRPSRGVGWGGRVAREHWGGEGARGREASCRGGWSQPRAARWLLPSVPGPARPRAPAAPLPARARRSPSLPGAEGTGARRVSALGKGTAWKLHLTALPNARLLPAGRTGGRALESQRTESGAWKTSSPEWARCVALTHKKGNACAQVPATPTPHPRVLTPVDSG